MVWPRLVTAEAGSIVKFPIFRFLTRSVRPFFKNLVKNPCFQVFDKKCHRYLRDVVNFLKFDIVLTRPVFTFLGISLLFFENIFILLLI